jgi:hypothetical protein
MMGAAQQIALTNPRDYPGPQREIRRLLSPTHFFHALVVLTTLLFFQSFVHDNRGALHLGPFMVFGIDLWSLQVLDNKSSATLIIGLLSLSFINRQLLLAYRPFLNYRCQQSSTSTFALVGDGNNGNTWKISLQNVGSGTAVVVGSRYRVGTKGGEPAVYEDYDHAMGRLVSYGFTNGVDFVVRYFSHGWSLAGKDDCIIAEIALQKALELDRLDVEVEFKGLLGDRYVKEMFCIPRRGIYPNNAHAQVLSGSSRLAT